MSKLIFLFCVVHLVIGAARGDSIAEEEAHRGRSGACELGVEGRFREQHCDAAGGARAVAHRQSAAVALEARR